MNKCRYCMSVGTKNVCRMEFHFIKQTGDLLLLRKQSIPTRYGLINIETSIGAKETNSQRFSS